MEKLQVNCGALGLGRVGGLGADAPDGLGAQGHGQEDAEDLVEVRDDAALEEPGPWRWSGWTVAVVVETAVVKMVKQREREAVELEVEEEEVVTDAQYEPRSQCNRRQSHNQNTTNAAHRHRTCRHH